MNEIRDRIVMAVLTSLLSGFGGCLGTGCAMFDPGGQVRRGLEQRKLYEWRDDGSFWVEGVGTQTERFTMIQGQIKMQTGPEGEPVIDWENSLIEYYLAADPQADVAGNAMAQALTASTTQAEVFGKIIGDLMAIIAPLLAPVPVPVMP